MTHAERTLLSKCALCGEMAKGRRNEHLLFECTTASVVKLRTEVEAAMEMKVSRLVKPGPVREAIMAPWRLDGADRPPDVEVMAEVEAALGTMLGAASPTEGLRRLVTRQGTGPVVAGGSRVQHQVHTMEEAGLGQRRKLQLPEQAQRGMRSGCSKLVGVEQLERGGGCWWMDRRMCQRRQGRGRLYHAISYRMI